MAAKTAKLKLPLFLKERGGNLHRKGCVLTGRGYVWKEVVVAGCCACELRVISKVI